MDIATLRLYNQQLIEPKFTSPEKVVEWFGAVQAQEYLFSLWAIGLRLPKASEASIKQAIIDRKIVRTWPMRGTIHYVPAEDAKWMTAFMARRINQKFHNQLEKMGLPQASIEAARPLLIKALEGGDHLTRSELYDMLARGGIKDAKKFGLFIVAYWAQEGLLCFGVHRGKQPTFTLLDSWVHTSRHLNEDESLAEITRRYFQGHGPATVHDASWWTGLTIAEIKRGIELANAALRLQEINGIRYYTSSSFAMPKSPLPNSPLLLPCFDEYTVAYKDRSAAVAQENLATYGYGVNWNNIIIDGRIAGAWKRIITSKEVVVELHPVRKLTKKEISQLAIKAAEFGQFIELPARLIVSPELK